MLRIGILMELALLIMICIGFGVSHSEESDSRKQGRRQIPVKTGYDAASIGLTQRSFSDPFLLRLS